jgi:dienelactone hydrolase
MSLRVIVVALLLGTVVALVVIPFGFGFNRTWALLHPGCAAYGRTPAEAGVAFKDSSLRMRDGVQLRAYFVPGAKPGLIISPPTYGAGRDGLFDELMPLVADGYALLVWESRACVGGAVTLGLLEAQDIQDAITAIRANPDQFPLQPGTKIGLHGFSAGGAAVTLAAAQIPEVAAVVTEGNFHNWDQVTGLSYGSGYLEWIFGVAGHVAYRLSTGYPPTALSPIAALAGIGPRPIFFVYGETEASLPGARLQLATVQRLAPDGRYGLWVVPGADHGFYATVAGPAYQAHVRPFYDCTLLGDSAACTAWAQGLTP